MFILGFSLFMETILTVLQGLGLSIFCLGLEVYDSRVSGLKGQDVWLQGLGLRV